MTRGAHSSQSELDENTTNAPEKKEKEKTLQTKLSSYFTPEK